MHSPQVTTDNHWGPGGSYKCKLSGVAPSHAKGDYYSSQKTWLVCWTGEMRLIMGLQALSREAASSPGRDILLILNRNLIWQYSFASVLYQPILSAVSNRQHSQKLVEAPCSPATLPVPSTSPARYRPHPGKRTSIRYYSRGTP